VGTTLVQVWITVDVNSASWTRTAQFPDGYYVVAPIEDGGFVATIQTEDGFQVGIAGTITGEAMAGVITATYVHPTLGGVGAATVTFWATRVEAPATPGQSGG
jgi:hypothetical protein